MERRKFSLIGLGLLAGVPCLAINPARALGLADFSSAEASQALTTTLERGARAAIDLLGKSDGFLGNERVKIALPPKLRDAESLLRTLGQGDRLDELVVGMNRAAEAAVPLARDLMLDAARRMTVDDAKRILNGGDTSVSVFFAEKTRPALSEKFLPIVTRSTDKLALTGQYNQLASKAADFGLIQREDASLERYVTGKALDGLYAVIADEERKIRQDPVGTGSALLHKVFGALK